MADNNCNACTDNIFTRLSSNPDISELIEKSVKPVIVESGDEFIVVDKLETVDDITYTVTYKPYVPLLIESFINNLPLQIKGFTVTDYILDWEYNIPVAEHSLDWEYNIPVAEHSLDNELVPAIPGGVQLIYQLIVGSQDVTDNITITLTADDITSDAHVPIEATTSIQFGNFLYTGAVIIADTGAYDPLEADIELLVSTLSIDAKGANAITYTNAGTNSYQIFAAPSTFTVNNFQDSVNPVPGGFVFVKTLNITNSENHMEEYTVWRTSFDNTAGTDGSGNPITFSII